MVFISLVVCMMSLKKWSKKEMTKIYMKDIKKLCSCIAGLSCQTIRTNEMNYYINKLNEFERLLND